MPAYPPPSLHSFTATGIVGSEYPYQQNIGRRDTLGRFAPAQHFSIGKRRPTLKHPLSVYTDCTTGSVAITALWNSMSQTLRNTWRGHAKRWSLPLRIAFGKFNMKRIVDHKPILDHPPD